MIERFRRHTKRAVIALTGGVVVLGGLIMVPYPGPGWLTVFAGLAILSTEFTFAQKLLQYGRSIYNRWAVWLKRQPIIVRLGVMSITGIVVVLTIWVVNGFGIALHILHIDAPWLISPLAR